MSPTIIIFQIPLTIDKTKCQAFYDHVLDYSISGILWFSLKKKLQKFRYAFKLGETKVFCEFLNLSVNLPRNVTK